MEMRSGKRTGQRYRRIGRLVGVLREGITGPLIASVAAVALLVATPGAASAAPGRTADATVFGSSIAAARNVDGRLELFGTNSGDAVFHRYQTSAAAW